MRPQFEKIMKLRPLERHQLVSKGYIPTFTDNTWFVPLPELLLAVEGLKQENCKCTVNRLCNSCKKLYKWFPVAKKDGEVRE